MSGWKSLVNVADYKFENASHISIRTSALAARIHKQKAKRFKVFTGRALPDADLNTVRAFDFAMDRMANRLKPSGNILIGRVLVANVDPHFSIVNSMWDVSKIIKMFKDDVFEFGKINSVDSNEIKRIYYYFKDRGMADCTIMSKGIIAFTKVQLSFLPRVEVTEDVDDVQPITANVKNAVSDEYINIANEVASIALDVEKGNKGIELVKRQIEDYLPTKAKELLSTPYGETLLAHIVSNLLMSTSKLHNQDELSKDISRCMLIATSVKTGSSFDLSDQIVNLAKGMGIENNNS